MEVDGVQVVKISYFVFWKLKNVIEWVNNDRVFIFKYTSARIVALLSTKKKKKNVALNQTNEQISLKREIKVAVL